MKHTFFSFFFSLPIVTNPEIRARGNAPHFTALTQRFHPRHQQSLPSRILCSISFIFFPPPTTEM